MTEWVNVESTNIVAINHDQERQVLLIKFRGGTIYQYSHVDQELVNRMLASESIGSAFHTLIKKHPERYPFRRID